MRALWRHYFPGTQGLIYVVDCNDRDRVGKARDVLHAMLREVRAAGRQDLSVLEDKTATCTAADRRTRSATCNTNVQLHRVNHCTGPAFRNASTSARHSGKPRPHRMHAAAVQEEMRDVAVLVLANKQDLLQALPVAEMTDALDLHRLRGHQWWVVGLPVWVLGQLRGWPAK